MINWAVTVVVLIAVFAIVMTAFGPFLQEMGVHSLPGIPGRIIEAIWSAVTGPIFAMGFTLVMVVMFCIYIIWKIIKKFIPNFPIPFKKILLKIPPLPQLERAGIFGLFDALVGVILSRSSFGNRFVKVGHALGDFVVRSTGMVISTAKEVVPTNALNKLTEDSPEEKAKAAEEAANANLTPEEIVEKKQSKNVNSPFTDTEKQIVNEQYQLCLAETTTPITSDMSTSDINKTKLANDLAKVKCDFGKLSAYSNALNFK